MSDLVAFLNARLSEDEAAARACIDAEREPWQLWEWEDQHPADVAHYGLHGPARVLREVEAKRRIVADCDLMFKVEIAYPGEAGADFARMVLAALVAVYSNHPDYDPAWGTGVRT